MRVVLSCGVLSELTSRSLMPSFTPWLDRESEIEMALLMRPGAPAPAPALVQGCLDSSQMTCWESIQRDPLLLVKELFFAWAVGPVEDHYFIPGRWRHEWSCGKRGDACRFFTPGGGATARAAQNTGQCLLDAWNATLLGGDLKPFGRDPAKHYRH
ncbi:hypothetical protein EDD37DRAFT_155456 [Exophiala viscosa]|uniref:uncharacterized protein n=1 Tax=Exophiala viscosa TaxID=2486360 RepID=UPI002192FCBF|nr:hypothetical protein EDD37DRAFT_155456 [Exophiala viscosa]